MTPPLTVDVASLVVSVEVFANAINITPRHCQQLMADGVLPKLGFNQVPLIKGMQTYSLMLQERTGKVVAKKQDTELLVMEQRRRRLQMENDEREGQLIPVEQATQLVVEIIALADESFEALADAIDTQCSPGADVVEAIEQHCQSTADALRGKLAEMNGEKKDVGHADQGAEQRVESATAAGAS